MRKADVHTAMFTVDADAAQRLIDYSGLKVFQMRPGRAVVNLLLTRFIDCDLGQYNEFSFCDGAAARIGRTRAAGVRRCRHFRSPHGG